MISLTNHDFQASGGQRGRDELYPPTREMISHQGVLYQTFFNKNWNVVIEMISHQGVLYQTFFNKNWNVVGKLNS